MYVEFEMLGTIKQLWLTYLYRYAIKSQCSEMKIRSLKTSKYILALAHDHTTGLKYKMTASSNNHDEIITTIQK